MRRKSTRTASKSTPEKAVESSRKSRRQLKRQRKSSSRSSSEEPKENAVVEQEKKDSEELTVETAEVETEMWKVTPSSTPTGEIQKLKFCLTRPLLSPEKVEKPTRQRRTKSASQMDEDITVSSDKMTRKLRHRRSSGDNFEDQDEDSDHQEDKKGKGKSKTKHKSKSEKVPQIQDVMDNSQSEISENVQVTPQSPQVPIDIAVDNENMSTIESETILSVETEQVGHPVETSSENSDKAIGNTECDVINESETNRSNDTPPPTLEQERENSSNNTYEHYKHFENAPILVRVDTELVPDEVVEEIVVQNKIDSPQERDEVVVECNDSDAVIKPVEETEQIPPSEMQEESKEEENEMSIEIPVSQDKSESYSSDGGENVKCSEATIEENLQNNSEDKSVNTTVMEVETNRSDDDSVSTDAIMDTTSTKDETSLDITQSFSPDIRQIEEVNEELQSLKNVASQILQSTVTSPVVRDWGNSCIALELMENSLQKIDINTIKEFCPNLKFLEENEIKMDIRERKMSYTQEGRERRIDRKVSIDFKSDDGELKRLSTQNSMNSEMDETTEPEVDNSNIIAMNRKISIVDDTASKLKPPPSPAKNPISELLFITNLVRPFTLKQLKELLERTGKIRENGFWTDRIKSKCYAYYETIEEAEATRNALHGVNWPIGNGKKLIIEYSTEEDFNRARNPTPPPLPPPVPQPLMGEAATLNKEVVNEQPKNKTEDSTRANKERSHTRGDGHVREWDIGKENATKSRYRSREREERERGRERDRSDRHKRRRTPSPAENYLNRKEKKKEEEVPQKLMDDLFRKTKTTPSIYWLPLTPDEIATKQQQRLLRMAEHKRRMEESSRGSRGDYGRGAPYRRRYD
ncbi:hypothetical protein RI129_004404 [Pyrocoelia pectoralis]|uniref:RRM domain-containing protein n=1 Tax=Pyrocoelia pectoralis TaxID=417401 RepID=A0AAN7VCA1_9COLE